LTADDRILFIDDFLAIGHGGFNRAIIVQLEKLPPEKILSLPIMKNTACMRFTLP
jgi:broad specificity phosphatase PhoE